VWAGWRGSAAWDDGKGYCGVLDGSLLSPRSRHSKGAARFAMQGVWWNRSLKEGQLGTGRVML